MADSERLERAALLGDNDSEDEEDDFFLKGPTTKGIKKQINEVTEIARDNVLKLTERGDRLETIEEHSARLDDAASQFRAGAYHLKRKTWWQQAKFKAVAASSLAILLLLMIIIIMSKQSD